MRKKLKFAEFWVLCKRELNYDLFNWKESRLLDWILDSRNDFTLRRFSARNVILKMVAGLVILLLLYAIVLLG